MSERLSFQRGAEWRKWDLHIHSPASFHWNGQRFMDKGLSEVDTPLVDQMIKALNDADAEVFALMDYWTFDGWFALQKRLGEEGAPELRKTVFPGIELRLTSPSTFRLNAHVLFSDEIANQDLLNFSSKLQLELINEPLSEEGLRRYARSVTDRKLSRHGFTAEDVKNDNEIALIAGSTIAEITADSYKNAIKSINSDQAIGFMPFDTSDGLAGINQIEHYAYVMGLFESSPIFESRNDNLRNAFVNIKTPENEGFFSDFRTALNHQSRLVVSGSDAHQFFTNGEQRGYANFPSDKATWIKADPTFRGLLQALKEPEKRSFIGVQPRKIQEINENKTYFLDRIQIMKEDHSTIDEDWFDGTDIALNTDLIAIIGNKGSGKSALADVVALLGNSKQNTFFSFLIKDRFKGKGGNPARNFRAELTWKNQSSIDLNLNEDPQLDKPELIRYIPQGHFENLCNDHVSNKSNAFENELREVIFQHIDDPTRQGAFSFDQLVESLERGFRDQLDERRKEVRNINSRIADLEEQSQPEILSQLKELHSLRRSQLEELEKEKPVAVEQPSEQLTQEEREASEGLQKENEALRELEAKSVNLNRDEVKTVEIKNAVSSLNNRIGLIERSYQSFLKESAEDLSKVGLEAKDVVDVSFNTTRLVTIETAALSRMSEINSNRVEIEKEKEAIEVRQKAFKTKLSARQRHYEQYLNSLSNWEKKKSEILGSDEKPDSLKGILKRIEQVEKFPNLISELQANRLEITSQIFDILELQRSSREKLYQPVQRLIQNNQLISEEYMLQFKATLHATHDQITGKLFNLIKQNAGAFRGEADSHATVAELIDECDFSKKEDVLSFVNGLHDKISSSATSQVGITSMLKKHVNSQSVYDFIYELEFLKPKYTLLFQNAEIEQLSPGQRGALLLIFYLLVDTEQRPVILDQPEENLDNETVVNLLVPVLSEAKKRRQIIMVTHNPNLAVVCDAEQIIASKFDRKNGSRISYNTGAIENPEINKTIVNVLEGTKPAFDNRRIKYD